MKPFGASEAVTSQGPIALSRQAKAPQCFLRLRVGRNPRGLVKVLKEPLIVGRRDWTIEHDKALLCNLGHADAVLFGQRMSGWQQAIGRCLHQDIEVDRWHRSFADKQDDVKVTVQQAGLGRIVVAFSQVQSGTASLWQKGLKDDW